ncbi:MAG: insulinase family protein [Candidatus Liptonbacteria bacterium]|nr:insulinase family protein [Candidatus Liptonbacteria bacterium]
MVRKVVLTNGLRIILVPEPSSVASTVLILVEAGSEYETKRTNGLSHFLEHMTFKGTKNRPKPGMISHELDSLGAQSNAFTNQEYTGYWAKVQSGKFGKILEIVSDLYLHPLFNTDEIEKERGVIIEEINMYEDTPMRRVQEIFTTLLYGDQPAGWDIAGRKEVIRNLSREDFVDYRNEHYVAPKTVVVAAGNFKEGKMLREIKTIFAHLPRRPRVHKAKTKILRMRGPAVLLKHKTSDQSHLVLGVRAFHIFDKRRFALDVLADVLGGGMSSRLFRKIREELGAAYYIRAGADLYLDHGYFEVSSGVDHLKIEKVIDAILGEFRRVCDEPVGREELQKSKDHLAGNLLLSLESADELASFYGGQEILTRAMRTPKQVIQKIQRVTSGEVQRVARALFRPRELNLAIIGPYKHAGHFKKRLTL